MPTFPIASSQHRAVTFTICLLVGTALQSNDVLAQSDVTNRAKLPGPKVGAQIKNFALNDQFGKKRTLSELLEEGPVAVVFHRSADW